MSATEMKGRTMAITYMTSDSCTEQAALTILTRMFLLDDSPAAEILMLAKEYEAEDTGGWVGNTMMQVRWYRANPIAPGHYRVRFVIAQSSTASISASSSPA